MTDRKAITDILHRTSPPSPSMPQRFSMNPPEHMELARPSQPGHL